MKELCRVGRSARDSAGQNGTVRSGAALGQQALSADGSTRYCLSFSGTEVTADVPAANGGPGIFKGQGAATLPPCPVPCAQGLSRDAVVSRSSSG